MHAAADQPGGMGMGNSVQWGGEEVGEEAACCLPHLHAIAISALLPGVHGLWLERGHVLACAAARRGGALAPLLPQPLPPLDHPWQRG